MRTQLIKRGDNFLYVQDKRRENIRFCRVDRHNALLDSYISMWLPETISQIRDEVFVKLNIMHLRGENGWVVLHVALNGRTK